MMVSDSYGLFDTHGSCGLVRETPWCSRRSRPAPAAFAVGPQPQRQPRAFPETRVACRARMLTLAQRPQPPSPGGCSADSGEKAFKDLLGLREALQFEDIKRIHGREIAQPLRESMSEHGITVLNGWAFRLARRCRSDPLLDRTTSYLLDSLRVVQHDSDGVFGADDMLRICGCRALANDAETYEHVMDLLTLDTFDEYELYRRVKGQPWRTGISCRAYTWLLRFCKDGMPRDVRWGAISWLRDVVVPQLRCGAIDKLYRIASGESNGERRNELVDSEFLNMFRAPNVVRTLILRDMSVATSSDSRGKIFDLAHCWIVLDGAKGGLSMLYPDLPKAEAIRRAHEQLKTHTNPCLPDGGSA
ncbi:unnamed protein product [Prorocentrum cordatum]|uniref:Uncharacterized protein n=1 Tax=Prorocentrum cordatum TaxID=2364126 RepID=A0ABN9T5M2_9DINO|nr:unnamed protein product [Polarella glacialis]